MSEEMTTDSAAPIETHPVQVFGGRINKVVTMRAYEVYCHVFDPQEAMVTGGCRGGFCAGELIAFLYAYPFPKSEWSMRVDEALRGSENVRR